MNLRILLLLLPLGSIACTPTDKPVPAKSASVAEPAVESEPTADAGAALSGYRWKLESADDAQGKRIDALFPGGDRALVLRFEAGKVGVSGGCNQIGGAYATDAQGKLKIGSLQSTMMACDEALMKTDKAVGDLLAKPLETRVEESAPPRLRLIGENGERSTWIGEATAETRYGGPGETVFLEVAPQRVACNHPLIPNHQCLQVREVRYADNGVKQTPPGEWQPLYEEIEGFDFVDGERKVLRLKKFKRDPAPADASSTVYVLDMAVETEIVSGKD